MSTRHRTRSAHRRRQPLLEQLENRHLMAAVITVNSTADSDARDSVLTLREAIEVSNRTLAISSLSAAEKSHVTGTPNATSTDQIAFNIPASDAKHFYYKTNNGHGVSLGKVTTTTAASDTAIGSIDPDWKHSWFSIRPTGPLPTITEAVVIDGYTQAGATQNTNPAGQGLNSVLKIEINGAAGTDMRFGLLNLQGGAGTTIRGLAINRVQGPKITTFDPTYKNATSNVIAGNYIGPDVSGTLALTVPPPEIAATNSPVYSNTPHDLIGGATAAARNLISDNYVSYPSEVAISMFANNTLPGYRGTSVLGNLIGTNRAGTSTLGNLATGLTAASPGSVIKNNVIGGFETGIAAANEGARDMTMDRNWIGTDGTGTKNLGNTSVGITVDYGSHNQFTHNVTAFNATGISVGYNSSGNLISQNSMFFNGLAVNLGNGYFVADNDVPPNTNPPDSDSGGNGIQNYPILSAATAVGSKTHIAGKLTSTPNSKFRIEFFGNAERSETAIVQLGLPGAYGEGRTFIGSAVVTTNGSGVATFSVDLPVNLLKLKGPGGQPFVTATATDITTVAGKPRNNTSEFSPVVVLGGPKFTVTNTRDTGLGTLREAIIASNLTPGAQFINFAIPTYDPGHYYYQNDGIRNSLSPSKIKVTTAATDSKLPANVDPDWKHSWFSIRPSHDLPEILDRVTINGYSQAGSSANTLKNLGPLNTVLKIELDGSATTGDGLRLRFGGSTLDLKDSGHSVIRGLAINSFGGDGIEVGNVGGQNIIAGNFIGMDVSGEINYGNDGNGVLLENEDGDTVGGPHPADANLISGNRCSGVKIHLGAGNIVRKAVLNGDRLGLAYVESPSPGITVTNANEASAALTERQTNPLPPPKGSPTPQQLVDDVFTNPLLFIPLIKAAVGVLNVFDPDNADSPDDAVTMFYLDLLYQFKRLTKGLNSRSAVAPNPPPALQTQLTLPLLGVDYSGDGVTPNDPRDADEDPVYIQNFPVLTSAASSNTATTIKGSLNSVPNSSFRIELYSSSYDTSKVRAGEKSLGTIDVKTNAAGNAYFTFVSHTAVLVGQHVIALASLLGDVDGNPTTPLQGIATSEFSAGIYVAKAPNHAPVLKTSLNPKLPTIAEDSAHPASTLVSSLLVGAVTDADAGAARGIAVVTASNFSGVWQYSLNGGKSWLSLGEPSSDSARLLPAFARLRFEPKHNFNGTVKLFYRAWDQTQGTSGGKLNTTGNTGGSKSLSTSVESATLTVTPVQG